MSSSTITRFTAQHSWELFRLRREVGIVSPCRKVTFTHRTNLWPSILAGLLVIILAVWLSLRAGRELITNTDELLSAERSREMTLLGPWAVHLNFKPSFAKPPLQYWLTAPLLAGWEDPEFAVRCWPMIFALLTLVATGWLARLLDPSRPWLVFGSVAILVTCSLFVKEAGRALLDSGLTLFAIIAIAFAQLARKQPRYWLGTAAACWLGAMQKSPVLLLLWLIILPVRFVRLEDRPLLANRWLLTGILLALSSVVIWPLTQMLTHGTSVTEVLRIEEAANLTSDSRLGTRPYFTVLSRLTTQWIWGSVALLAAVVFIPLEKRTEQQRAVAEISILSLSTIVLALLFNYRSERYLLPIVPMLCILSALLVHRVCERGKTACICGLTMSAALLGFAASQALEEWTPPPPPTAPDQLRLAEELGSLQSPGTRMIIVRDRDLPGGMLNDSFYLFYGKLRHPLQKRAPDKLKAGARSIPAIGICRGADFPAVRTAYPTAMIRLTRGDFICWQAAMASSLSQSSWCPTVRANVSF